MRARMFLAVAAVVVLALAFSPCTTSLPPSPASISVCFTPGQDCDDMLIQALNAAQTSVYMAAYTLTSAPIADALIAARQRGATVEVVLDRAQWRARRAQGHRLRKHGIGVRYDCEHQIMHNKYVIIDLQTTVTGSYNFTEAAQRRNGENLICVRNQYIAQKYADNWEWHWSHSVRVVE